jgi:aspartyl-tRNA(Asn)/glutamyl-tRNA(Gln) amidotransferase subunit C
MKVDKKLITRLEALARIELSPDSINRITSQLETIVAYIDQLAEVDTSGIQPAHFILHESKASLREDKMQSGISKRDGLEQAPDATEDFFRVPRVIQREDDQ